MDNKDGELEVYAKETIRNDGKKWIIYDTDVHNSLTKWKQERVQPRTDLAFYDIIDISPGSNSGFVQSLPRDVVHEIRRSKSLSTPNMDNIDGMKDYIIDFIKKKNFRNYVDESYMKTRINNTTKFIWDYLNFLVESFERDNDLADYNLSELGGEKCLFASSEDRNQEKNDKEDRNAGRKVDIIWSMKPTDLEFFVGEVSGPPNQRNHTHFFNDKIKIAKMLKVIFNRVVKKYGGAGMSLSLLKLYGLHVYYNEVIIYEMSIPFRGLYVFCEVLQSKLPTNKVEVGLILRSASVLLKFKGLLEKSLTDLKDYIQDACTRTPDNNEDADQYITHTDLTPTEIDKLTAKISELEHAKEENVELKAEVAKLRRDFEKLKRQTQAIANAQDTPSIGNIPEYNLLDQLNSSQATPGNMAVLHNKNFIRQM
ncbi:14651_t:CDS:2, partial [Entrophospora sp. SA101]